jgi:hypothetical protein
VIPYDKTEGDISCSSDQPLQHPPIFALLAIPTVLFRGDDHAAAVRNLWLISQHRN